MGENIGIKFIEPDAEMEDDMEISSGVQKRRLDKLHVHRQPRVKRESSQTSYTWCVTHRYICHIFQLPPIATINMKSTPILTLQVLGPLFIGWTPNFICPIPI